MLHANGTPGDLLLEQVEHPNLKTTSEYTHFRWCVSSANGAGSGAVLAGGWSQWSQLSGYSEHTTCHV